MTSPCTECGADSPAHFGSCSQLSPEMQKFLSSMEADQQIDIQRRAAARSEARRTATTSIRFNYDELWELASNFDASFEPSPENALAEKISKKLHDALKKLR